MVEFTHQDNYSGNTYRSRIPLAVSLEMVFYAPCGENMFIWLDIHGRIVGGGTLKSEMIEYAFIPEVN